MDHIGEPVLEPASADASFRRYFRVRVGDLSYIAMDAPPGREDCTPFVRIAGYLDTMGLNATRVLASDLEQGFLLLTDLGDTQYLERLQASPGHAARLYEDAIQALLRLQGRGTEFQASLPAYDSHLLTEEMALFRDWLCRLHLGVEMSATEELAWRNCGSLLIRNALDQPKVFVHRDYHSRNLMVTTARNPGLLDFQDAVEGPLTYDVVSLLRDCYYTLPPGELDRYLRFFHDGLEPALARRIGHQQLRRWFDLMGVQRHLKAAGIFARLWHRDGKAGYLNDVPTVLGYLVDVTAGYPELSFLHDLVAGRVLPALEKRRRLAN